jgi:hypothetical protein
MTTRLLLKGIVPVLLLLLASPVLADDTPLTHSCTRPELPEKFTNQSMADQFMAKANGYRECINAFIDAHHQASLKHQDASAKALDEWNAFAAKVNEKSTPATKKKSD